MPRLTADAFPDFFIRVRPSILTPENVVQNLARATKYPAFEHLKGQDPFNLCQGGSSIIEIVKVRRVGTFAFSSPAEADQIRIVNTDKQIEFPWRKGKAHVGWTDDEYRKATRGGDKAQVKRYANKKRNDLREEMVTGLNTSFFDRPDYSYMEPTGVAALAQAEQPKPYSLLAFISEDPVRFAPPALRAGTDTGPVWVGTALLGLERNLPQNFYLRNHLNTYIPNQLSDPWNGVVAAFDKLKLKLGFMAVPQAAEAFGEVSIDDIIIYTNADGYTTIQTLYRNAQDRFTRRNDAAIEGFSFDGMPFMHVPDWDTLPLEQTVGANAAYQGRAWDPGKPRYVFHNRKHLHWVFDQDNPWTERDPVPVASNQQDTKVVYAESDYQLCANRFNAHGIVAPYQVPA